MHITDPTAVGDVNEVYDMDVINLDPEDFEYKQVTVPLADPFKCVSTPESSIDRVGEQLACV